MGVLSKRDAASVRRMRDLLERYRPSARAVADELVHELAPAVGAEGAITFRAVRGELGWSAEFLYATADPEPFRDFILQARDGWSPFFPVTPEPLRNRALRTRHIHRHLAKHPTPARKDLLDLVKRLYDPRLNKDDLGVAVCDGDMVLAWVGATRAAPFGPREIAILDAVIPALRARMLLEHQLGHALATHVLLEAALDAVPTAAFILAGSSIAHANETGRQMLARDRTATVDKLRESMRAGSGAAPFAITQVGAPRARPMALAVLRGDGGGELGRRLAAFAARYRLTRRQGEVLALLARGYGNKTIAERIGVTEGTVEEHVTLLFRKARVDARAVLVAKFWMEGAP